MPLRPVEARVLACLIEKETTVPDTYPLTAKALLAACNQSTNRSPVTNYDEHTLEQALQSLKADGLVRFVHPSHGGRTLRYRHVADECWDLGRGALGVLAYLVLRGPETAATLRSRAERHLAEDGTTVELALEALMLRDPEPFAERLERGPGEREPRYAQLIGERSATEVIDDGSAVRTGDGAAVPETGAPPSEHTHADELAQLVEALIDEVAELRRRVDQLESIVDI